MANVTLQLPSGSNVPTDVYLSDGTHLQPDASGQISAPSTHVSELINSGWQIVIAANQTHVP
jgi:hypothetical protein